jgi:hypothetical protein
LIERNMIEVDMSAVGVDPREALRLACFAEETGIRRVALADVHGSAPFVMSAAIVMRTIQLHVHIGQIRTGAHSAALLAMKAVTTDGLAPGRISIGMPADLTHSDFVRDVRNALRGETLAHFGGFRLGGIEAAAVPLLLEATMVAEVGVALGADTNGVIIDGEGTDIEAIAAAVHDQGPACSLVVLIHSPQGGAPPWPAVERAFEAGADIVRLVPNATEAARLRQFVESIGGYLEAPS